MSFLRQLMSFMGMFQGLFGMLMPGLMIFFPVVSGGSTVRVRGEFVELGSSLVRVIWHCFSPSGGCYTLEPFLTPHCPLWDSRAAANISNKTQISSCSWAMIWPHVQNAVNSSQPCSAWLATTANVPGRNKNRRTR